MNDKVNERQSRPSDVKDRGQDLFYGRNASDPSDDGELVEPVRPDCTTTLRPLTSDTSLTPGAATRSTC